MKQSRHMKSSITITNPPCPSSSSYPIYQPNHLYLPHHPSQYPTSHTNHTSRKRAFSLPKTQPTKSSSRCRLWHQNMEQIEQIETCPEVSQFRGLDNSMYIHKMNIDYGHLEEPTYWPKKMINIDDESKQREIGNNLGRNSNMNSKRSIVKQIDEIPQQRGFEDIGIIKSVKAKAKSKSMIKLSRANHVNNQNDLSKKQHIAQARIPQQQISNQFQILTQQNENKNTSQKLNASRVSNSDSKLKQNSNTSSNTKFNHNHIIDRNNPKLKQVLAAKMYMNQSPIVKHLSQQSTYRNSSRNTEQKTQRRVPHCRIVKTYVGGNKMQVKIISYPDNSEYMRLCGHGKLNETK